MIRAINVYLDDFIPDWHNRLHRVQYHVLVLVTEGQLTYCLNNCQLQATAGELLFIPSGTHREAYNDDAMLHQKYAVTFNCDPFDLELSLPLIQTIEPIKMRTRAFDYFKERFYSIYRQSLEQRPYSPIIQAGILLEMLGMVSRELESPTLPKRKQQYIDRLQQPVQAGFHSTIYL